MIREAVIKEREFGSDELIGIAGGACGGDILFHEVCEELKIPTRLFLAKQVQHKATRRRLAGARSPRIQTSCHGSPP
jgi:hypothetical protein